MLSWRRAGPLLSGIVLIALLTALRIADPSLIRDARLFVFDTYQRLSPRPYQPVPVRVIDIDDASLARFGQWPWPRTLVAQLVDRLGQLNAAAIAFDIIFSEPDRLTVASEVLEKAGWKPPAAGGDAVIDFDSILADAIARYRVVGGFALLATPNTAVPAVKTGFATLGGDPGLYLPALSGALTNIPILEQPLSGNGSLSMVWNRDAIVRQIPLLQKLGAQLLPSLSVEALRVAQGADTIVVRSIADQEGSLGLERIRVGAVDIPVSREGRLWLHYTRRQPERTVAAWRVLEESTEPELAAQIAGHIVLIGTSATALSDLVATPLNPVLPGVLVHAQALEQMMLGWSLQRPFWADGAETLLLVLLGLLLVLLMPRVGAVWCAVIGGLVVAVTAGGSWLAFQQARLLLDPVFPALATLSAYLLSSFLAYLRLELERTHIRRAFAQYLAPDLLRQLETNPELLTVGGEAREMSFLFSDIIGFTSLTEQTPPQRMVPILNAYLDGATRIIMEHGGNINKIIGDAIFALFSAPLDQPDHAERAVRCALALNRFAAEFSAACVRDGIPFGLTRIGINTGIAVVGNFGGERRFDYTAIGDVVNVSSRLEEANRTLGTTICVAAATAEHCVQTLFRPIGKLLLRGKTIPVQTYQPLESETAQNLAPLAEYKEAYELMERADAGAGAKFQDLAARYPRDALVVFHARRLTAPGQDDVVRVY